MEYINKNYYFFKGLCYHFPSGYVACENNFCCNSCMMAERLRQNTQRTRKDLPLFDHRDCLKQTPKGGGESFYRMPVVLSPSAMERLGLEPVLINQIVIALTGSGCFKQNPVGPIDGYLLNDRSRSITVYRSECLGVPTPGAAKRYDDYFFLGLLRFYKNGKRGDAF